MSKTILTDIEGTTSSIAFVKETLFPYARKTLPEWLLKNRNKPAVRNEIDAVADSLGSTSDDIAGVTRQLLSWIDDDVKATPLKNLQGILWQDGYENGDYQAHIYADAIQNLQDWYAAGTPLYVYSSGSIKAQQLFFKYSVYGDVSNLFSGFFDTTSGAKTETSAYLSIAEAIDTAPADILFLSDIEAELEAASSAGMSGVLLVRKEDSQVDPDETRFPVATSFHEVAATGLL